MFKVLIALLMLASLGLTQNSEDNTNIEEEVEAILQCLDTNSKDTELCRAYLQEVEKMMGLHLKEKRYIEDDTFISRRYSEFLEHMNTATRTIKFPSCSKFMNTIKTQWENYYNSINLEENSLNLVIAQNQTHHSNSVYAKFTSSKTVIDDILKAAIYIERKTSQEIGEVFGEYKILVNQVDKEGQVIGEPLYDNLQYGCPSENGNEIIVPLENIEAIKSWQLQANSLINLKVEVIPLQQRFVGNENTTVPVILDVTGMSLIRSSRTPESVPILNDVSELLPPTRVRRSPHSNQRRKKMRCGRVSHVIKVKKLIKKVIYPKKADVHECVGHCHYPLSSHLNATNHGILLLQNRLRGNHHYASVDCVPISYSRFYYFQYNHGEFDGSAFIKNFGADYCGCR